MKDLNENVVWLHDISTCLSNPGLAWVAPGSFSNRPLFLDTSSSRNRVLCATSGERTISDFYRERGREEGHEQRNKFMSLTSTHPMSSTALILSTKAVMLCGCGICCTVWFDSVMSCFFTLNCEKLHATMLQFSCYVTSCNNVFSVVLCNFVFSAWHPTWAAWASLSIFSWMVRDDTLCLELEGTWLIFTTNYF